MNRQWEAEHAIKSEVALRLIQEQFPQLAAQNIRFLGAGWDNTVFVIDETLIFRFPRREVALPLLDAEWNLLPALAPRLTLPIPIPEWRGSPTPLFPWPFIGYRMLAGQSACHENLSENERAALAEPIARFLAHLHATPSSLIAHFPVLGDNRSRVDAAKLIPKIETCFTELGALDLFTAKIAIPEASHFRSPTASTLVHGDFYVRHLLVDEKHHLAGVIDWGDVHIGDPAIDLSNAHSFLPPSAHAPFRAAYGTLSEATWQLARLRGIYSSCLLLLYGHHSHDSVIAREGLRSLNILAI